MKTGEEQRRKAMATVWLAFSILGFFCSIAFGVLAWLTVSWGDRIGYRLLIPIPILLLVTVQALRAGQQLRQGGG